MDCRSSASPQPLVGPGMVAWLFHVCLTSVEICFRIFSDLPVVLMWLKPWQVFQPQVCLILS